VNHAVHFYGTDDELADSVGRYLADGIRSGDGVVVVATAPHRLAFEARLAREGLDAGRERRAGRLLTMDASGLLGGFLADGRLDHDRFEATATALIGYAAAGGRPVRVYAEMVALLWDAGDIALAIQLEDLWNELGARLSFSLLCGYPASGLAGRGTADPVRDVCQLHSAVADQRSFTAELASARAARHYVTGLLGAGADEAAACDTAIVAAELAANAVLHARSGFTLTLSRSAGVTRIAVRDRTPVAMPDACGPLDTRASDTEVEVTGASDAGEGLPFEVMTGHGLSVVAQLASRWAVDPLSDGKVVWAELPVPGLPVSGRPGAVDPR
jgi:anti-sigma regulatory factor (Ser/Thr protein kinase)